METLAYIAPWVFSSVCVGVAVGFFVGRGRPGNVQDSKIVELERQATLKVLVELLEAAERVSGDVAAPREGDALESVFARADEALYKSKRLGRNQVNCQGPPREGPSAETGGTTGAWSPGSPAETPRQPVG